MNARSAGVSFDAMCRVLGLSQPVPEYRFAPPRRWRFDYAWVEEKVALEVQGGLFVQGRHSRGAALLKEHEKLNTAAALGWRVMYCTPKQLRDGDALTWVQRAIAKVA
jgi:hypothetical protein